MLWLLKDKRPWFAPKRFGLGAGLPIAWQGWALIALYLSAVGGIGVLAERSNAGPQAIALFAVVTVLFVAIAWKRTQGGWHWRWGDS